jgi:hypothetical protein
LASSNACSRFPWLTPSVRAVPGVKGKGGALSAHPLQAICFDAFARWTLSSRYVECRPPAPLTGWWSLSRNIDRLLTLPVAWWAPSTLAPCPGRVLRALLLAEPHTLTQHARMPTQHRGLGVAASAPGAPPIVPLPHKPLQTCTLDAQARLRPREQASHPRSPQRPRQTAPTDCGSSAARPRMPSFPSLRT